MKKLLLLILIIATLFLTGCAVITNEEYVDDIAVITNKEYTAARTVMMTQPYVIGKTVGIRSYPVHYPEEYEITISVRGLTKTYEVDAEDYHAAAINDEVPVVIHIIHYEDGSIKQEISR